MASRPSSFAPLHAKSIYPQHLPVAVRLALKFGYDGRAFHGFPRQPGQRTVEGDILDALREIGVLASAASPCDIGYGAASRTDAGVSAVGNVIAFNTTFRNDALLPALNARLDDIWFHSLSVVPEGFRPRDARLRWYRYHLSAEEAGKLPVLRKALRLFEGTHDFRNFCRPEGKDATRTIQKIRLHSCGPFLVIDLLAQSFLWNMVRRLVGASIGVSTGEIALKDVESALRRPDKRQDLGLAPAEPLILMDVVYDFDFQKDVRAMAIAARQIQKKKKDAERTMILASYLPT